MTIVLKYVIKCEVLGLDESFQGSCFGHIFSKTCQYYAIIDGNICRNFKFVSIKSIQSNLQKCITWPKKSRKGRHEWNKACSDSNLPPRKLNIPMKTRWLFNLLQKNFKIIVFFISYWFVLIRYSNIAILSYFTNLPAKSLCFKKHCNSRMLLLFITIGRILSE
jgi:hypothetical protein